MPLGMVGGIGLCIGVLDFGSDRRRKGQFWGFEVLFWIGQQTTL